MKLKIYFLLSINIINIYSYTWVDNSPKDTIVSYIYAPGTFTCECRMAIYMPKFVSSTCEEIICNDGIEVLKSPAIACNFAEISLKRNNFNLYKPLTSIKNIVKEFIYKLSGYCNKGSKISILTFCEGKKASLSSQLTDISKINFGQNLDISVFKQNYEKHLADLDYLYKCPNKKIILYGFSRGAATIFNFVSLHNPPQVQALICEGMFDSIENVLSYRFRTTYKLILNLLEKFTHFKKDGICPIISLKNINPDLPILLIASSADYMVPHISVLNIYNNLKKAGHLKVHILILKNSGHLNYVLDNWQDKNIYEQTVHAFYRKYNLPHIEQLALKGQIYLDKSQP